MRPPVNRHFRMEEQHVPQHEGQTPLSVKAGPELSHFYLPALGTQPGSWLTSNKCTLAFWCCLERGPRSVVLGSHQDSKRTRISGVLDALPVKEDGVRKAFAKKSSEVAPTSTSKWNSTSTKGTGTAPTS